MALLDEAASTARSVPYLAFVPALASLLSYEKLAKTAAAGPGGGVKFPLPAALPDLWTFVSVPNIGVSVNLGVPLLLAPVFFVVQAALTAGYLGGIGAAIEGERPDFTNLVAEKTLPVLGVQLVVFALTIAGFSLAFVGGMVLAPVSVLLGLAVGYLLWADRSLSSSGTGVSVTHSSRAPLTPSTEDGTRRSVWVTSPPDSSPRSRSPHSFEDDWSSSSWPLSSSRIHCSWCRWRQS